MWLQKDKEQLVQLRYLKGPLDGLHEWRSMRWLKRNLMEDRHVKLVVPSQLSPVLHWYYSAEPVERDTTEVVMNLVAIEFPWSANATNHAVPERD